MTIIGLHLSTFFPNVPFSFSESCSKQENNQQTENQLSKINDSALKCDFCSKNFTTKQDRREHLQTNHPDKWFQCSDCDKQFPFEKSLKAHKKAKHKQKTTLCKFCPQQLDFYGHWKSHMQGSHKDVVEKEWFKCEECKAYFENKQYLNIHHSTCNKTEVQKFKCDLIQHSAKLQNKPTYKSCHICTASFFRFDKYISHMNMNHFATVEKEWYLCEKCKTYFPDDQYLLRHRAVAHKSGEKNFKCNFCSHALTTKQRHSEHMKRNHSDMVSNEWNECSQCKKHFPSKQGLRQHRLFIHQMSSTKKIESGADEEVSHFPSSQIKDVPIEKISSLDNEEMQMETSGKSRYVDILFVATCIYSNSN